MAIISAESGREEEALAKLAMKSTFVSNPLRISSRNLRAIGAREIERA